MHSSTEKEKIRTTCMGENVFLFQLRFEMRARSDEAQTKGKFVPNCWICNEEGCCMNSGKTVGRDGEVTNLTISIGIFTRLGGSDQFKDVAKANGKSEQSMEKKKGEIDLKGS